MPHAHPHSRFPLREEAVDESLDVPGVDIAAADGPEAADEFEVAADHRAGGNKQRTSGNRETGHFAIQKDNGIPLSVNEAKQQWDDVACRGGRCVSDRKIGSTDAGG